MVVLMTLHKGLGRLWSRLGGLNVLSDSGSVSMWSLFNNNRFVGPAASAKVCALVSVIL